MTPCVIVDTVIVSFRDRATEAVWNRSIVKRFGPDVSRAAYKKMLLIHAANNLNDLRAPPGNHLEKLKGDRKGQHSIKVNDQWRLCFKWLSDGAHGVELTDYH
jgi:toxin HigB-1